MPRAPPGPKWSLMFMDLILAGGCLDNRVVGGTEPRGGAAASWGFQTQGSRMAGAGPMSTGLPAPSFITHSPTGAT